MIYEIKYTNQFEKEPKNRAHMLVGEYSGYWECHIEPDWLLVYEKFDDVLVLSMYRTGSHSDIFK